MASMKTDAKLKEKAVLNTTIKKGIYDNFKACCKESGIPMNVILEAFMEQFVNEEFVIKIAKPNKITVDLEDDK